MTSFILILITTGPTVTAGSWHPNVDGHKTSRRLPPQSPPPRVPVTKLPVIPYQGHQPHAMALALTPELPSVDGLETTGSQESHLYPA